MVERIKTEDKKVPGTTFSLTFQLIFNTSLPVKTINELKKKFGNKDGRLVGISKRFKDDFLKKYFDVDNEHQLVRDNLVVKRKLRELKDEIINESGLENHELQLWIQERAKIYLTSKE